MRAIKAFLDSTTDDSKALAQKCELLEELTEIVENIDFARGAALHAVWQHPLSHSRDSDLT